MTGFKKFLSGQINQGSLTGFNASSTLSGTTLFLEFNSQDVITAASFEGSNDIWMASLCDMLISMPLSEARMMNFSAWETAWKDDQLFWDMKLEIEDRIFFEPLELLHSALDFYRGREFLYQEESPLICRCFGVRESDVISYLRTATDPTLDDLAKVTKAGMGCRTCVPQLKKMLLISSPDEKARFFKSRPVADWVEIIDSALSRFSEAASWKMNILSMKGNVVMISYETESTQKAEEEMGKKLQGFLAGEVDVDLTFFLRRSRQR